ncbi:MAG: hypothetical protein V1716_04495 [Candidatus Uhrbacteria bacterium]
MDRSESPEERMESIFLEKFNGAPKKLIPIIKKGLINVGERGLVPVPENLEFNPFEDFAKDPSSENLGTIVFLTIAEAHEGFFPERDMKDFRKRVDRHPDCATIISNLCSDFAIYLPDSKIIQKQFVADSLSGEHASESQFVGFLKFKGKYFAIDQAAWYYGPESNPWFYIIEGKKLEDLFDEFVKYLKEQTRESKEYDKKTWTTFAGLENSKNTLVQEMTESK